jgi:hydroxymethylbilane synthase
MPQSPSLRLGTRGSPLALAQASLVANALSAQGTLCEIVTLKTSGDRIQDKPLADIGGKGLFVKELEEALLTDRIDFAVHSMKDVPADLPPGLALTAFLPREDPRDAFVARSVATLGDLPKGARLGTSSVRREAQVRRARPDLEIVLLRGNVDTRLARLDRGEMDGVLLAVAGLKRLGLAARATQILDGEDWLPALAQGAIGIEIRETDTNARELLNFLNHKPTEIALDCERAFQSALGGSCRSPIAGLARIEQGTLSFHGEVLSPDGRDQIRVSRKIALGHNPREEATHAGREAGESIRSRAARWLDL